MDISKMSVAELRELAQRISQEMKRREVQEKSNALNAVKSLAKARGYSLDDLIGKETSLPQAKAGPGNVKVKYRHPEQADLQWTGRGRKPKWVEAWLSNGGRMETLAV